MGIKADKQRLITVTVALVLAAAIILSSVFTVAAASQSKNSTASTTESTEVKEINTKAEYELPNGDLVIARNRDLKITVDVVKANEVTIEHDGKTETVYMAKGTVEDALKKAEIKLDENQVVVPVANTLITGDTKVKVCNAKTVTVISDGYTKQVDLPLGNIVKALNGAGYKIDDNDMLSVSRKSKTQDISEVTIQRVTYEVETAREKIDFKTVERTSNKVDFGQTKVETEGKKGIKEVTRKWKYVDGEKVSSETLSSKTIKKPVDKVVVFGLKGAASGSGAGTFKDIYGNTVAYSRVVSGSGTAYTAPAGALTATGVPAYHGGVAVNPNIIPYGSKLYITSTDGSFVYGYATAVDTGGALMDGSAIVDCFYNTYGECVNFGRRNVNVYIVG